MSEQPAAFVHVSCSDCGTRFDVPIGKREDTICPGSLPTLVTKGPPSPCRRRYRAFGRRPKYKPIEFYRDNPSTRPKTFYKQEDGRFLVSYVYDEVPRYLLTKLSDVVEDVSQLTPLLTGLCIDAGIPMVIMHPSRAITTLSDAMQWQPSEMVRIDPMRLRDMVSPVCRMAKAFAPGKCHECDQAIAAQIMNQGITVRHDPFRYDCWLGRTEFALPLIVHDTDIGALITGQTFTDTPDGRRELSLGIDRLSQHFSEAGGSYAFTQEGILSIQSSEHEVRQTFAIAQGPLTVTADQVRDAILREGESGEDSILTEDDLKQWKERLRTAGRSVTDHLEAAYRARREESHVAFLNELFALIEWLPTTHDVSRSTAWLSVGRILRRICDFTGFQYGALLLQGAPDSTEFETKVACKPGAENASKTQEFVPEPPVSLPVGRLCEGTESSAGLWYDLRTPNPRIQQIVEDLHRKLTPNVCAPTTGYVSFINIADNVDADDRDWDAPGELVRRTMVGFVLWGRTPRPGAPGIRDRVGPFVLEFLPRVWHVLAGGLRKWYALFRLRETEQSRIQTIAAQVHGLRASLYSAQVCVDMLEGALLRPEKLTDAEKTGRLLQTVSTDLVAFGRQVELANLFTALEAGAVPYRMDHFHAIGEIVASCVDRMERAASRREITFQVDVETIRDVSVKCDPDALDVAITAVLDNAVKYSYDSRTIKLTGQIDKGRVLLRIEDFGHGILPQEVDRIFRKFERGSLSDAHRPVPGTGIGLWVASEVLSAHGGSITCASVRGLPPSGQSDSPITGHKVEFVMALPCH